MNAIGKSSAAMKGAVKFAALYAAADAAGKAAAEKVTPVPMVVAQHANVLDDSSPIVKAWYVPSGVCGFAWVKVKATGFGKWAVAAGVGYKNSYEGGVSISVRHFGQSYEKKVAYAAAFANVLNAAGVKAYADDRLD